MGLLLLPRGDMTESCWTAVGGAVPSSIVSSLPYFANDFLSCVPLRFRVRAPDDPPDPGDAGEDDSGGEVNESGSGETEDFGETEMDPTKVSCVGTRVLTILIVAHLRSGVSPHITFARQTLVHYSTH